MVKPDGTTIDITAGVISVPEATSTTFGVVKPDDSTVTISGGVISAVGFSSPMTSEGDLIQGGAAGAATRLAIGSATQVPSPVGSDVRWLTPVDRGGFVDPTTTDGDLIYRKATAVTTLSVGFIGDSITHGSMITTDPCTQCATDLTTASVTSTGVNQGVPSSQTSDWLPSGTNDTAAVSAFASCPVVHIMLGTNDSTTTNNVAADTYRSNLRSIVNAWVQRGKIVFLSYPIYPTNASYQASLLLAYQGAINSLIDGVRVRQGDTSGYLYFQTHTGELQSDGVHPTQTGSNDMAQLWANALRGVVQALTEETTLQRLTLGTNLSITSGVLDAPPGGQGYAPMVLGSAGATSPTFIVNSQGQPLLVPIS